MMDRIDTESVRFLFLVRPAESSPSPWRPARRAKPAPGTASGRRCSARFSLARQIEQRQKRQQQNLQFQAGPAQAEAPKPVRAGAKVGRNDPCPCGSGKKYKKCHGTES